MQKSLAIVLNSLPVVFMIALIPLIVNDYALTIVYILIIFISLAVKRTPNDVLVLVLGFFVMILAEAFFISTGVETFNRNTLFGLMPLWLPFLWSYGFVAIKRSTEILSR